MPSFSDKDHHLLGVFYVTAKGRNIILPPLMMQVSMTEMLLALFVRTGIDELVEDPQSLAIELAQEIVEAIVWTR